MRIAIDGYNLIAAIAGSSLNLLDLEAERESLIGMLADYRSCRRHVVEVVFDGWQVAGGGVRSGQQQGIKIVFSPLGMKADLLWLRKRGLPARMKIWMIDDRPRAQKRKAIPGVYPARRGGKPSGLNHCSCFKSKKFRFLSFNQSLQIFPVMRTVSIMIANIRISMAIAQGVRIRKMPRAVAIPFPPLNPRKTG